MSAVTSAAARVAGVLTVTALVAGVAAGCGDDDPPATPAPSPSQSSTQSSTQSPTASESESASPDPTGSTEAAVTPASGLLLEEETSRLHAPDGDWERIPDIVDYATAVGRTSSTEIITLSDRENFASPASLAEQVKFHNRTLPEGAIVERQPDVLLDGAPAYYVQWYEKGDTKIQHDIGLDHDTRVVSIKMDLDRADPAATEALVASVLASFTWR